MDTDIDLSAQMKMAAATAPAETEEAAAIRNGNNPFGCEMPGPNYNNFYGEPKTPDQ